MRLLTGSSVEAQHSRVVEGSVNCIQIVDSGPERPDKYLVKSEGLSLQWNNIYRRLTIGILGSSRLGLTFLDPETCPLVHHLRQQQRSRARQHVERTRKRQSVDAEALLRDGMVVGTGLAVT